MNPICVIGSLNVDLTISLPRFHAPGETLEGSAFLTFTGGKGGNQAVALGRLGAPVCMVAKTGEDENGNLYRRVLEAEGVDTRHVAPCDTATGIALIEVHETTGENRIALYPGANARVDIPFFEALWPELMDCDIFLMQLETPMDTVEHAAQKIHQAGKLLILDPAPAQPLSEALLRCAACVTPNETELALLTGLPTETTHQVELAAKELIRRGARQVVAKMGAAGALWAGEQGTVHIPGFSVQAVDTTAAGDSFNAGLAFALGKKKSMPEAVRFANAVGALATTAMGAQAAMPDCAQAMQLLQEQERNP